MTSKNNLPTLTPQSNQDDSILDLHIDDMHLNDWDEVNADCPLDTDSADDLKKTETVPKQTRSPHAKSEWDEIDEFIHRSASMENSSIYHTVMNLYDDEDESKPEDQAAAGAEKSSDEQNADAQKGIGNADENATTIDQVLSEAKRRAAEPKAEAPVHSSPKESQTSTNADLPEDESTKSLLADNSQASASKSAPTLVPISDNLQDNEDRIIRHFDGTNEIYVKSRSFVELFNASDEHAKSADQKQSKDYSIQIDAPKLHPTRTQDDSNIFGIVSSGILPCVDSDKSFDNICIEESDLCEDEGSCSNHNDEVYASKLAHAEISSASSQAPFKEQINTCPEDKTGFHVAFGLPLPKDRRELHPDDSTGAQTPDESFRRFAIARMCNARFIALNNNDVDAAGTDAQIRSLLDIVNTPRETESPRVIYVRSDLHYERNRLAVDFLTYCGSTMPGCTCYTTAACINPDNETLVSALIASRIGCFPLSPEDERISTIIRECESLFDVPDRRWGKDQLFIHYGLPRLVSAQKDLSALKLKLDTSIIEVLLNIIEHDAQNGPVFIAITQDWLHSGQIWRDLIKQIRSIRRDNVIILLMTSSDTEVLADCDIYDIPAYTQSEIQSLIRSAFSNEDVREEAIHCIANAVDGSFASIHRAVRAFAHASANSKPLPDAHTDIDAAYCSTFTPEELRFLGIAALLNEYFYLDDLVQVFSQDTLPRNLSWFYTERSEWCRKIANALTASGELVPVTENETKTCYFIPERAFFRTLFEQSEPELASRIRRAYVVLLEPRLNIQTAKAAAAANRNDIEVRAWLKTLEFNIRHYFNESSDHIIEHCLELVMPEMGEIYPQILSTVIPHQLRLCRIETACQLADHLIKYGNTFNNADITCTGFNYMGSALRMMGSYNDARELLERAIKIAEVSNNSELKAETYLSMAQLMLDAGDKGALVNALRFAEKSLEIYRKSANLKRLAKAQTICANIYQMRGEPTRSENAANEAYRACSAANLWADTPYSLAILAETASILGNSMPLESIENGLEIAQKTGNIHQQQLLLSARIRITLNTLQKQSVRSDLDRMQQLVEKYPLPPWIAMYHLLTAQFDFSRKNFQKTTNSLKSFFESATSLGNAYLLSIGYALSAELNFEVLKRNLAKVSLEKTGKLYHSATTIFESVGAWHQVAETLRRYADFLDYTNKQDDAENARHRASKLDPYCQ